MIEITPPVRVRFAPSPTGFLHIGGVRTALFNWLFARHYGGQFILRLEDTDEKRYVEGAANDIMASLRWVGLGWDEGPDVGGPYGPYVQSVRSEQGVYKQYIDQLLAAGQAYMSFTREEELEQMRADAAARGVKAFRFRGPERDWTLEQMRARAAQGQPYTIRLKTPLEGATSFSDLVRGGDQISVNHSELQDIILIKSTGMPVYHFAHLVDDHLMGITHVLRSDEWVPSTPYHVLLYQAFGWQPPIFAHVPPILRQDGRGKLSKRKDDVATNRFWERGYLPEAMFNYLALQGWSYDDHTEIMTRDELVERIAPYLGQAGLIGNPPTPAQRAYVERLVPLIHERLEELGEAPDLLEFFFREVEYPEPAMLVQKKMDAAGAAATLQSVYDELARLETWSEGQLEEALRALVEQLGLKAGQLFGTVRVAVTGRTVAPPLFETLAALGKERSLARIAAAKAALT